jgi:hypothetical protein
MRRLRMLRKLEALGIALRREFDRWRRLWCLLSGRVDRRAGVIPCVQRVVVRRN